MEFVAWTTAPAPQARAGRIHQLWSAARSAAAMVGNIEGTEEPMGPNLPTFDANMAGALASDLDFWVDRDAELIERFNSWLAADPVRTGRGSSRPVRAPPTGPMTRAKMPETNQPGEPT